MAKYTADQLRQMLARGQAMRNPSGDPSYPIGDDDDLSSAVHAVGLGGASNNAIRRYIMGRAKAMGKTSMIPDTWQADGSLAPTSGRSAEYTRSFALEDISIRAGGDGRTVDAYAAVFDTPAAIRDGDGEYEEVIDPAAFNRAIDHATRSGHKIPVMFNHGQTMYGTPSELDTMPIGVTEEIKADRRGLFTRARYHRSDRADSILEGIREGSIGSYSFQGAFKRSDPAVPRGGFRRNGDRLPTVRRTESTLREYGPTPFPAYDGAAIVGVRALAALHPTEINRLLELVRSGALPDLGTPSDDGPAAEDPPADDGHSVRSFKQQIVARRARFLIEHGDIK